MWLLWVPSNQTPAWAGALVMVCGRKSQVLEQGREGGRKPRVRVEAKGRIPQTLVTIAVTCWVLAVGRAPVLSALMFSSGTLGPQNALCE